MGKIEVFSRGRPHKAAQSTIKIPPSREAFAFSETFLDPLETDYELIAAGPELMKLLRTYSLGQSLDIVDAFSGLHLGHPLAGFCTGPTDLYQGALLTELCQHLSTLLLQRGAELIETFNRLGGPVKVIG